MVRIQTQLILLRLALGLAALGRKKGPTERAPVAGGETLSYIFYGASNRSGTITIKANGDGFILDSGGPGFPPEEVEGDLGKGRDTIRMFHLGKIWLPPSQRAVGSKNNLGDVAEHRYFKDWQVASLIQHSGAAGKRFYDLKTGFLVGIEIAVGGEAYRGELRSTTIPGLF